MSSTAKTPHVTVAVPVYAGERYLAGALEAVLGQTWDDYEVLVVDDRSPDGSLAVAERFAAEHARVRVVRNDENLGLAGNWNRCLDLARGELIHLTHQDDVMHPRFLERVVAAFGDAPGVGLVHTRVRNVDGAGAVLEAGPPPGHAADLAAPGRSYAARLIAAKGWPICCPAVVMRRGVYDAVGRFDPAYGFSLDVDMWLRALCRFDAVYLSEPLLDYRRHDEQQTARERKVVRYAEVLRAKIAAFHALYEAGALTPTETDLCRRGLARACLKVARKFARPYPATAREHLRMALRFRRRSLLSANAAAAVLRLLARS